MEETNKSGIQIGNILVVPDEFGEVRLTVDTYCSVSTKLRSFEVKELYDFLGKILEEK